MEVGALSGEACGGDGRDSVDPCRGRGLSTVVGVRIGKALYGGGGVVSRSAGWAAKSLAFLIKYHLGAFRNDYRLFHSKLLYKCLCHLW